MTMYHNQINNSNSKMKTSWYIIKSVSSRQNEHKTSKYQILWTPLVYSYYQ